MTTDSTDLHAVGCLLHLFPEVVGLGSSWLQVARQSWRLVGLIIPADKTWLFLKYISSILRLIWEFCQGKCWTQDFCFLRVIIIDSLNADSCSEKMTHGEQGKQLFCIVFKPSFIQLKLFSPLILSVKVSCSLSVWETFCLWVEIIRPAARGAQRRAAWWEKNCLRFGSQGKK